MWGSPLWATPQKSKAHLSRMPEMVAGAIVNQDTRYVRNLKYSGKGTQN